MVPKRPPNVGTPSSNPFSVTKAIHFSDQQIMATWVEPPPSGHLLDPLSPTPMLILGGKGSGRTHLMRYLSYPVQRLRRPAQTALQVVKQDLYIGVYLQCEGLNAGRFQSQGQDEETWSLFFVHYFDLWLAQLTLNIVKDLIPTDGSAQSTIQRIGQEIFRILSLAYEPPKTIEDIILILRGQQKQIDISINNVALTGKFIPVQIAPAPGELVFALPKLIQSIDKLKKVNTLYLIDEIENLSLRQQEYINTLLRDSRPPTFFKLGSRTHGFKSYRILGSGEENREGSEFESLRLDEHLRGSEGKYKDFARHLVWQRIVTAGYEKMENPSTGVILDDDEIRARLGGYFALSPELETDPTTVEYVKKYSPLDRPYFTKLRKQLLGSIASSQAPGVKTEHDASQVINALSFPQYPLLEKVNIFQLYKNWARHRDLVVASARIREQAQLYLKNAKDAPGHARDLGHFRADFKAQVLRECGFRPRYEGLDQFIQMSSGFPRLLLVILKHIYQAAVFHGEKPFTGKPISARSQQEGIRTASNWFYEDARNVNTDVVGVRASVERLATFFRALRFADKPADPSLITFGVRLDSVSKEARERIIQAEDCSLLLRIPSGYKDKNSKLVMDKLQLNPMLSPRYDLATGRRGATPLSNDEVEAIFGNMGEEFEQILRARLVRMMAPFREGATAEGQAEEEDDLPAEKPSLQPRLPGID